MDAVFSQPAEWDMEMKYTPDTVEVCYQFLNRYCMAFIIKTCILLVEIIAQQKLTFFISNYAYLS